MNLLPLPPLDAAALSGRTGWRVVALEEVDSTNDEATRLRDAGVTEPTVVVADRQRSGRGRGGHRFASPDGGLYASLLVGVRPEHLPAALVAAVSVALAEAVEEVTGATVWVKWPNDLWIAGRKVAGILVEASLPAGAVPGPVPGTLPGPVPVIVGVGVNLRAVPGDLEPEVAAATTALDAHAATPVDRGELLGRFLVRFGERMAGLGTARERDALEDVYRRRLALRGEPVRFFVGAEARRGVLRDASLSRGLCVEGEDGASRWVALEHVRELRRDAGGAP